MTTPSLPLAIGIDLGTTNSAIAYLNELGKPELVPSPSGLRITPSVVQLRPDGSALVGSDAKQEIALEKENTAQFFKRDMGMSITYEFRGKAFSPIDLSAAVLRQLKTDAEAHLGHPVTQAVITVPAYFQDAARLATQKAGELAGLEVLQIINEPTAAALAYGLRQSAKTETVLVYDLGGGTFDVTLVRIGPDAIEVVGTDGNHNLGGKDWDDLLAQHVCAEFDQRHGIDPLDDPYAFQEILVRIEEAKRTLSERTRAAVTIHCGGKVDRVEFTREEFESLTAHLLTQTEMLMTKVLAETGYDWSRIDSVLMVGGSTRMPMCGAMIQRLTGKAPNVGVHPDECVAMGAALQARECLTPAPARRLGSRIRDVMSHSMGLIAVSPDGERYLNSILIPKNLAIPCEEVRPYQLELAAHGDRNLSIYVTQGESEVPMDCGYVGKYVIDGFPAGAVGKQVLDIAYAYDASGVVHVKARDRKSGKDLQVKKEALPEDMSWVLGSPKARMRQEARSLMLAVDLSGSMAGPPLQEAKKAILGFLNNCDLAHNAVGLIAFSDMVRLDAPPIQDGKRLVRAIDAWTIGEVGYGNDGQPFDEAFASLQGRPGSRVLVVLTDGIWYNQPHAINRAKRCHAAGIEVIALGFGKADRAFLKAIATSDETALFTRGDLVQAMENIAQVLVEGSAGRGGLSRLRA